MSKAGTGTTQIGNQRLTQLTLAARGASGSSKTVTHNANVKAQAIRVLDAATGRDLHAAGLASVTLNTLNAVTINNLQDAAVTVNIQIEFVLSSTVLDPLSPSSSAIADGTNTITKTPSTRVVDINPANFVAPNANYPVTTGATIQDDALNASYPEASFGAVAEEGVGFELSIPENMLAFRITHRGRSIGGAGGDIVLKLYARLIPENAAVAAWFTCLTTTFTIPANTNWQKLQQIISLSTLGLTAGRAYLFELTRDGAAGGDTLVGHFAITQTTIEMF